MMMTELSLEELGPVDYMVVEFPVIGAPVTKTAVVAAAVTPQVGRRRI